MLKVGLTGGIGSGKSEVSRRLAVQGAIIVDADQLAREVVRPGTPGFLAVVEEFGPEILHEDGSLDRERLGGAVFTDSHARQHLNAIIHPLVAQRTAQVVAAASSDAVIVHDVPLLVENNLAGDYDVVVVVDTSEVIQRNRLTRLRGMTEQQAQARIAAQTSREQRLEAADIVIDNSGSLEELDAQVRDLWQQLHVRSG